MRVCRTDTTMKFFTAFLIVVLKLSSAQSLKVSIYYESLCPDSVRFITRQLYPSYYSLSSALELDFVPYGKANHTSFNGSWEFTCQHGAEECYGNKYQACFLAQNYGQDVDLEYVNCVMNQTNPAAFTTIYQCAIQVGVQDFTPISDCFATQGDEILAQLGDRTHAVEPTITFVPTIIYDDVFDQTLQDTSLTDFAGVACGRFNSSSAPSFCRAESSLKVSIYYESLCPDSVRFITRQLYPAYYNFTSSLIDLDFVPYGKATHNLVNGSWEFTCQHGAEECYGNKYQACFLAQNYGQNVDLEYVNCVMNQTNPAAFTTIYQCAIQVGVTDFTPISDCFNNEGDDILANLGDQTHAVQPTITFVPTIIYNDVFDQTLQDSSLTDFAGVVCGQLNTTAPSFCTATEGTSAASSYGSILKGSLLFVALSVVLV